MRQKLMEPQKYLPIKLIILLRLPHLKHMLRDTGLMTLTIMVKAQSSSTSVENGHAEQPIQIPMPPSKWANITML